MFVSKLSATHLQRSSVLERFITFRALVSSNRMRLNRMRCLVSKPCLFVLAYFATKFAHKRRSRMIQSQMTTNCFLVFVTIDGQRKNFKFDFKSASKCNHGMNLPSAADIAFQSWVILVNRFDMQFQ